jgi:hypothetical protein
MIKSYLSNPLDKSLLIILHTVAWRYLDLVDRYLVILTISDSEI